MSKHYEFPGGIDVLPGRNGDSVSSGGFRMVTIGGVPYYTTDGINFTAFTQEPAGSIPLASLAPQAADTFVANGTGGSASPTAITAAAAAATGERANNDHGDQDAQQIAPAASPSGNSEEDVHGQKRA